MVKVVETEVSYVDHMGSDKNVVNAARVSFAKQVDEFDPEKDTKLINYLAKHNHWSPLAHTSISIRVKAPIFMARQFVKHCVGGVWNEVSRRYVDDEPEFWLPKEWRKRADNAKQGSGDETISQMKMVDKNCGESWECEVDEVAYLQIDESLDVYEAMLMAGICPEQARMFLPQNTMTEWIWTGSLVFFARVVKLRTDAHAQKEAQEIARKIADVVSPLYPVSWKALMDHMVV